MSLNPHPGFRRQLLTEEQLDQLPTIVTPGKELHPCPNWPPVNRLGGLKRSSIQFPLLPPELRR